MIIREHELVGKMSVGSFLSEIEKFNKKDIEITEHTLFRIEEGKRRIEKREELKSKILTEKPLEIWKQRNGNLALFYKEADKRTLKILIKLSSKKVYIVTFMILNISQEEKFKDGRKKNKH